MNNPESEMGPLADELKAWLGTTRCSQDSIDVGALARFKATIGSAAPPDCVPQGFHWCLCLPETATAELGADGHPAKGDFLPPAPLPRRMWAASEIEFLAPLMPHDRIERASRIAGLAEKTGATGRLIFVEIEHTTRANERPVIVERQTIVYRDAATAPMQLPCIGKLDLSDWPWHRSISPDSRLLFRYSALTFNSHRIHYDLPYTTGEELYPDLVVHGPLMATLLLDLCARWLGPNALTRFSFRVLAPAFAGQALHLVGRANETIELRALGADGRTVLTATGQR